MGDDDPVARPAKPGRLPTRSRRTTARGSRACAPRGRATAAGWHRWTRPPGWWCGTRCRNTPPAARRATLPGSARSPAAQAVGAAARGRSTLLGARDDRVVDEPLPPCGHRRGPPGARRRQDVRRRGPRRGRRNPLRCRPSTRASFSDDDPALTVNTFTVPASASWRSPGRRRRAHGCRPGRRVWHRPCPAGNRRGARRARRPGR